MRKMHCHRNLTRSLRGPGSNPRKSSIGGIFSLLRRTSFPGQPEFMACSDGEEGGFSAVSPPVRLPDASR